MKRLFITGIFISLVGAAAHADFAKGSQTAAVFGGFGGSNSDYSYQPGTDRPIRTVDDLDIERDLTWIQFQAELLLNGRHQVWSGFVRGIRQSLRRSGARVRR